jgi:hypothetical protein
MRSDESFQSQQYNLSSNQNGANFITLGNIPEEEKIEIIKTHLKKYYESTDPNSLFQSIQFHQI